MNYFYGLLTLAILNISSAHANGWLESLKPYFPEKIRQLEIKKTTKKQVLKKLGPPDLVEKNKYYWKEGETKYPLELTFDGERLVTIHYNFQQGPSLSLIKISPDSFKPHNHIYMKYEDKNGSVLLDVRNKTIYSVTIP